MSRDELLWSQCRRLISILDRAIEKAQQRLSCEVPVEESERYKNAHEEWLEARERCAELKAKIDRHSIAFYDNLCDPDGNAIIIDASKKNVDNCRRFFSSIGRQAIREHHAATVTLYEARKENLVQDSEARYDRQTRLLRQLRLNELKRRSHSIAALLLSDNNGVDIRSSVGAKMILQEDGLNRIVLGDFYLTKVLMYGKGLQTCGFSYNMFSHLFSNDFSTDGDENGEEDSVVDDDDNLISIMNDVQRLALLFVPLRDSHLQLSELNKIKLRDEDGWSERKRTAWNNKWKKAAHSFARQLGTRCTSLLYDCIARKVHVSQKRMNEAARSSDDENSHPLRYAPY